MWNGKGSPSAKARWLHLRLGDLGGFIPVCSAGPVTCIRSSLPQLNCTGVCVVWVSLNTATAQPGWLELLC